MAGDLPEVDEGDAVAHVRGPVLDLEAPLLQLLVAPAREDLSDHPTAARCDGVRVRSKSREKNSR